MLDVFQRALEASCEALEQAAPDPVAALLDGASVDLCALGSGARRLASEFCGAVP